MTKEQIKKIVTKTMNILEMEYDIVELENLDHRTVDEITLTIYEKLEVSS